MSEAGNLIAVIGLSCRLPQAPDPASFWRLLRTGTDAITPVPEGRWGDPSPGDASKGPDWGGFLADVDCFDPEFFGISPREAAAMDPQQRLALELAWEALEDAGIPAGELRGSAAGVFMGAISDDYATLLRKSPSEVAAQYRLTGTHRSLIANRVSYVLGLRGPSLTVDSGQSSSLVCMHLASESLRRGECVIALAGGVNLNLAAESNRALMDFGALSPDGRCFTFDARANGYVRGEGGGLVVLKKADQARADGDRIYCLIRGSAVNNDGGGAGLTVPATDAQGELLRQAYRNAGVDPATVQYVELHGSATRVGDPVEAAALGSVLGVARPPGDKLSVGSVKTNVGHLEAAAGVTGLLKTALSIWHRELPPSLHFAAPSPEIPLDELNLRVQRDLRPWPASEGPLLAGVSAFGMGGTNCHVVLSDSSQMQRRRSGPAEVTTPWVLSARTPVALRAQAARLHTHLNTADQSPLDVAYSLATTRSALPHRAALVADHVPELLAGLKALADGEDVPALCTGMTSGERAAVFVFPGQGSQWIGMGRQLLDTSEVFAASMADCAEALAPHLDWCLLDVLSNAAGASHLDHDDVVQPALFAIMVSLAELWRSWGVRPEAVVGHSQGEIAAACVAGALSVRDAARVVAVRSRLLTALAGSGAMASLQHPVEEVRQILLPWSDRIGVAGVNGPSSTLVSGDRAAMEELLADCARRELRMRRIPVEYASHSPHIEAVRDELLELLASVEPRVASVPIYSTTTGELLDRPMDADYWYRNLRQPVLFEAAVEALLTRGHNAFIEISPHPVLTASIQETAARAGREVVALGTLRRGEGGMRQALTSLARAHVHGVAADWHAVFADTGAQRVDLPTYAFQRQRYWLDTKLPDVAMPERDVSTALLEKLRSSPGADVDSTTLTMVRAQAAVVLGHLDRQEVDPDRTFKDLGFDSSTVVELCDRLNATTGLRLAPSVVFDSPTPYKLARQVRTLLLDEPAPMTSSRPEAEADEPIAVIGMGCRFPGGVSSPEELWHLVAAGLDVASEFPADRGWDLERAGTSQVRAGGFLHGATDFDPGFFGISPREALAMDPQQRLLLEMAWEAIERGGINPQTLHGSQTGVFVGATSLDYGPRLHEASEEAAGYVLTGSTTSVASGRVAYSFGFEGPAVTVDTACSSSLVALHLAGQSLRSGECDLALAGGVTVMATPGMFVEFSRQRGLAPDGRCKSFAESADGTGWSEGAGLVLLERLSDARRNGREVLAVVRGSAVNQDGASNGLTAPNGPSQRRVITQALANAKLSVSDVDAVEAHGTGTRLGDPIEAQALIATYGQGRGPERPLWLGSMKSNIGHAQAAAGIAGVIKMVMAMRHGQLPATLHVDEPTSQVDWSAGVVRLLTERMSWPENGRPRRAGVSSFGISGTNAHVILEQPPQAEPGDPVASVLGDQESNAEIPTVPWLVSGKTPGSLRGQAARLLAHVESRVEQCSLDVAFSLASGRAVLEERAVVLGSGRDELAAGLRELASGREVSGVVTGSCVSGGVGIVFSGQGGQWLGMGRGLYGAFPVFADAFDDACAGLDAHLGQEVGVRDVVFGSEESLLDRTLWAQSGLFALQVGLLRLLDSWGVRPDVVLGHSVGEFAAAFAAGVVSLSDAARLVAGRARLMQALPSGGAMLAVATTEARVNPLLEGVRDRVGVAAVNAPGSVVLSGDREVLEDIVGRLDGLGVRWRWLRVSHAFHSYRMVPMLDEFAEIARTVDYRSPRLPIVSTLTGNLDDAGMMATPEYWVRQAREPVRFADGVQSLVEHDVATVVELGPDGALSALIQERAAEFDQARRVAAVPAMRRYRDEAQNVTTALAQLHVRGVPVEWRSFFAGTGARRVELPTYAFQRQRYWLESSVSGDVAGVGLVGAEHPLLGAVVALADGDGMVLTGRLSVGTHPWLVQHRVLGEVVVPGTAILEMALHAGARVGCGRVEELTLEAPLVVPERGGIEIQLLVNAPDEGGRRTTSLYSRRVGVSGGGGWTRHATGELAVGTTGGRTAAHWSIEGAESIALGEFYVVQAGNGFEYGPMFQGLRAAWRRGDEVLAEVATPVEAGAMASGFLIDPALLDAALQASALGGRPAEGGAWLPFSFTGVELSGLGGVISRVRVQTSRPDAISVAVMDDRGRVLAVIDSLRLRSVSLEQLANRDAVRDALFEVTWKPVVTRSMEPGRWVLLGDAACGESGLIGLEMDSADRCAGLAELAGKLDRGEQVPDVVVYCAGEQADDSDVGVAALSETRETLALLQSWLVEPRLAGSRLVVVTCGAVATGTGDGVSGLAHAPLWGLLRSAQSENPGQFVLVDVDGTAESWRALPSAVGLMEPQLALRKGVARVPRLASVAEPIEVPADVTDPERTVLVSGGTGLLGGVVARHLVTERGVRRLVLTGRRGLDAPGITELVGELKSFGAVVDVVACDVADRADLESLLAAVPAEFPLCGVVHAAGVLADGVIESLSPEDVGVVFGPKAAGAWNLHELTRDLDLSFFALYSSLSGVTGAPGQGNYAAANAFLDALAHYRRAQGLPAVSMAWGLWEQPSGITERLSDVDRGRIARSNPPLSTKDGLRLFDAGLALERAVVVPARLNRTFLAEQARSGTLPAMLTALVPTIRVTTRSSGTDLADEDTLLGVVQEHAATVLGYSSAAGVGVERAFRDLGFDSLSGVELRNRLTGVLGVRLPATAVFDYPTPRALARFLHQELAEETATASVPVTTRAPIVEDDLVAIVGMGCRFPGQVSSPEELWRLVAGGVDSVADFPADRGWDLARLFDSDPDRFGTSYVREGGFLRDAAEFDAGFFGISPREALAMDPQQRLLLELSWEAVERAGIDPVSLRGSRTGVFAGLMYHDYAGRFASRAPEGFEGYLGNGSAGSVASGRVAYSFGFEGPAVTVDTACSSSLVALHLAGQSLRSGECDLALAGGVTVMSTPATFVEFSRQRGLAPDGRCKSFAESADGTGWGEGAGLVLLERLSDARRNKHRVLAVIRGSAVNQDGASNGLTAPNGPSQQRVIQQALASAGLEVSDVDAVEAHGTGTRLGDPIEAQALIATYGQGRDSDRPLWLGSMKSNIGHTQAAAGVAGVIKMVMAMRHGQLPRTLHVNAPSSQVDWSAGSVQLLTENTPWPDNSRPRRVGVSSFGISGTNAHIILEQSTEETDPAAEPDSSSILDVPVVPWVVSATTPEALSAQAATLVSDLDDRNDVSSLDVGYSLAVTRSALDERAVVLGSDRETLLSGLKALAAGHHEVPGLVTGSRVSGRIGFMFAGQGGQWLGMGRRLYSVFPVFADAFDEACDELDAHLGQELRVRDVVFGSEESLLDRTLWAQSGLFALQVGLWELLGSWGVRPDVLLGHSVGEFAAAFAAGVLSLPDAARLVAGRARLMQALPSGGAMLAVAAGEEWLRPLLADRGDRVGIAAVNAPESVVLSGDREVLDDIAGQLDGQGVRWRWLRVSHAFHSYRMVPMLDEFAEIARTVDYRSPRLPIVSTLTGNLDDVGMMATPEYWVRQAREPVRFADGVQSLVEHDVATVVELGPDGALSALIQERAAEFDQARRVAAVPAMRRYRDEAQNVATALAQVHVRGVPVEWRSFFAGTGARRVELPTYAFQRQRYWLNAVDESSADDMGRRIETEFWSAVEHEDVTSLANVLGIVDDGAAVESLRNALPVLAGWQRTRNIESIMDRQCYRIGWRQVAGLPPRGTVFGTWLVFAPHAWSGEPQVVNCVAALRARGASVVLVEADPDPIVFADRVRTLCSDFPDLIGVLSMLCLEESALPGFSAVSRGFALTVELVRALEAAGADARLWLMTCGGVSVGDVPVRPGQALAWGLGRVVGLEHPDWWGGLVDIPALFDEDAQERLSIVLAGLGEEEVAIRSDGVFARRLVRHGVSAGVKKAWRPRGSVLVTGGTGGLGAHAARWLADAGAEHVVMVSRRGEQAPSTEKLRTELEDLGTRVSILSCDVTDREALAEVLKALPAEYPLTAVVHTAGVIETGDAASMSLADFDDVLSAKVAGAANLDALLADVELDAFVLFSSVSGIWGAGGQGAYAAANAYLDALAEERRSRGLVATAVAWGPWAGEGMAAGETGEQLRRYGLSPMAPQHAIAGIRRAVEQDEISLVVADVDWARFGAGFLAARPRLLLNELAEVNELLVDVQSEARVLADASAEWRQRLAAAPRSAQEQLILELVRSETALVLGHPGAEAVASERAFKDSGFDSQAAVELRVRLNRATGLQLPSTIIFSHPTPAELAAELRARLLPESAGAVISEEDEARIRAALTSIPFAALREADLVNRLLALAGHPVDSGSSSDDAVATSIDAMDVADLVEAALGERES